MLLGEFRNSNLCVFPREDYCVSKMILGVTTLFPHLHRLEYGISRQSPFLVKDLRWVDEALHHQGDGHNEGSQPTPYEISALEGFQRRPLSSIHSGSAILDQA